MIRCRTSTLVAICHSRGVTLDEVRGCIVFDHSDGTLTVDTNSPAFPKHSKGLGDHVADGLAAVGITKERVSKVLGRDCGCKKRQELLNKIGQKVVDFVRGNNGDKLDDRTH